MNLSYFENELKNPFELSDDESRILSLYESEKKASFSDEIRKQISGRLECFADSIEVVS